MRRVKLFLKGNSDIYDSLHSCRINQQVVWNGLNQLLQEEQYDFRVQTKHETCNRTDALVVCNGLPPQSLLSRALPLETFSYNAQFSDAIFSANVDAFIFSIQPDVATSLIFNTKEKYLLYPHNLDQWGAENHKWFKAEFKAHPPLTAKRSMDHFRQIIHKIRLQSDAPILIYNLCAAMLGDTMSSHQGFEDCLSTRILRFNLALIDLSIELGIHIVDVNRLLSRSGSDQFKIDTWHINAQGQRIIAKEVAKILSDCGLGEGIN